MPVAKRRDVGKAWAHLNRALGVNTENAWRSINRSRRRIWRLVK